MCVPPRSARLRKRLRAGGAELRARRKRALWRAAADAASLPALLRGGSVSRRYRLRRRRYALCDAPTASLLRALFFFLLAPPLRPPLQDVPPILVTPKYYLVSILRGGVYVLATVATEVRARARAASCQRAPGLRAAPRPRLCPTLALAFVRAPSPPPSAAAARAWMQTAALSVIEFLHRVYDVFHEYFGEVRRTHRPRPFFCCCERPARSARAHIVRALFPLRR